MPVKKGSKKKKSGKKSKTLTSVKDEKEDMKPDNLEPGSVVSGTLTDPLLANGGKNGKKKVKKKKLTKAEKAVEKLEKAIDKIKEDEIYFNYFLKRANQWLIQIAPKAKKLFQKLDITGDGILTYEEFKSGMFDLNVPFNRTELHLLTKLLDPEENGEIIYTELTDGIQYVRPVEYSANMDDTSPEQRINLILSERKPVPCSCCKMGLWQPYREIHPRYLLIELKLVTFDTFKDHPGHLSVLVHSHLGVYGLIEIIIQQTNVLSTKLAIFTDKSRSLDVLLPVESTLEDCGYFGGLQESPQEITLFYDYTVEFRDCPILMCDHYFGQNFEIPA